MVSDLGERRTLKDGVYNKLREGLMAGEYKPGERLTVRGVAESMGTSAMPVREALRRLMSEGAIELLPNGAVRVPIMHSSRLREITEIRIAVEGLAARKAAERMTAEEIADLRRANDQLVEAIRSRDTSLEARANERFHFTLYRAAGSFELTRIIEHLWLQVGPSLIALLNQRESNPSLTERRYVRFHKELISAVHARDGAAAEAAISADLREGETTLARILEETASSGTHRRRPGRAARRSASR